MHPRLFFGLFFAVMLLVICAQTSWGSVLFLPKSMTEEVLSESVPTALPLDPMEISDFKVRWEGEAIAGLRYRLAPGTIQWVRVSDLLVIPRARLILDAEGLEGGQVSNGGFTQIFQDKGHAEIPVALVSGEKNPISVTLKKGNGTFRGNLVIEFKPEQKLDHPENWVYLDPSCSPYQVSLKRVGKRVGKGVGERGVNNWVYVGCRLVRVEGEDHRTSSLEVFVFWDNVGQSVFVNGVETPSTIPSVWPLRLTPQPGQVLLQAGEHFLKIEYHVPNFLHSTGLSMGLGPYSYTLQGGGNSLNSVVPMVTLYGSYFVTDSIRVVGFGATTLDSHSLTDLGLYLYFEYNRFLDRRVTINLLVGGHGVGFGIQNQYYWVPSLPQGFEITYSDAFSRGKSLKMGAFIYPLISNSSYYNVWLRWGGQWFVEANYISWQLQPNLTLYNASNAGLSVGFPLFQLW